MLILISCFALRSLMALEIAVILKHMAWMAALLLYLLWIRKITCESLVLLCWLVAKPVQTFRR